MKNKPTLYEWAGGMPAFEKWILKFYDKVLADELLAPVFQNMSKEHQIRVAHFIAEVFGGSKAYTSEGGSHSGMIKKHIDLKLTEKHRQRVRKTDAGSSR